MKKKRGGVLGMTLDDEDVPLTNSIERELRGKAGPYHKVHTYARILVT